MKKKPFSTELAYLLGLAIIAIGVAFMERADFGVSMVVAPAYLLYLKISQFLPFFTFGMAEYTLQAVLLIALMLVIRKFRPTYLFSFATVVLYGFLLDGAIALIALLPDFGLVSRVIFYVVGLLLSSAGVSLIFHTYIPPEVYELFVKEVSATFGKDITRFKTAYDCVSCVVGILLSFAFFGLWHFEGVKLGTILCALVNGKTIGLFTRLYEKYFTFTDALPLRSFFEKNN